MELYKQFKEISPASRAYIVASLLGLLGLVLALKSLSLSTDYSTVAFGLSMIVFAFGFMTRSAPWMRLAWRHWFGRAVILILNILVLLLSTALSRNIVAAAIGLPPQDFDLSVGFVALAMYPLAWCFVVAIPISLLAIAFQIWAFLLGLVRGSWSGQALRQFGHFLGAFAVLMMLALVADGYATLQKHAYPVVRWIAFFADYQTMPAYPGVLPNERVRLHENGVLSFPLIENGVLVIRTRKYEGA